jgi:hypothetical protein
MGNVDRLAAGIHHQQHVIPPVGEHQVVDHPTGVGGQQTIALAARGKPRDIDRHQRFKSRDNARHIATQQHLPHVADVKQPCMGAGVQMFCHDPGRVLDRHVVTREGAHPRACRAVQTVQRQGQKIVQQRPQKHQYGSVDPVMPPLSLPW